IADYSTQFGGTKSSDVGNGISVDSATGRAYVAGVTSSRSFFTTNILVFTSTNTFYSTNNPALTDFRGALTNSAGKKIRQTRPNDAFVAVLSPEGTNFVGSILLGGSGSDIASGILFDPSQ